MSVFLVWSKKNSVDYGETLPMKCTHCNTNTYMRLIKESLTGSLITVPLIPNEFNYYLVCDKCSYGVNLTKKEFEHFEVVNRVTQRYLQNIISRDEYKAFLQRSGY